MADDFTFTEGSGRTGAAREIGGKLYPKVIEYEEDGSATALAIKLGATNETPPASDTAASGLNGRLQRIAQRLTSLIALFPTLVSGRWPVDGSGVTQPISAASLPLPTGAATELTLGSRISESDFDTKVGSLTESAPASDTASSGLNGRLQRIAQRITTLIGSTLATSVADGSNITLGSKADPKSTATDTTAITIMSVLKQVSASVQAIASSVAGTLTVGLPSGASTSANQTTELTRIGDVTETAPASDTASSGLNGRLQRIAQRLTSIIALLPTGLGANGGLKIEGVASGTAVPVSIASVPSHAVTNAGTFAVQDSEKIADDAAFSVASTKVSPVGYLADESSTDSVDEGDIGAARMTLDRKQHVVAEHESNSMRAGGSAVTPKFAAIAASTSGNNTIVGAVNPKKIRVVAVQLIANAAVNAKWQSGASGTDITGLAYLVANSGYILPYNPAGWFETASNTLLNLNLSGAIAVGGSITYIEV